MSNLSAVYAVNSKATKDEIADELELVLTRIQALAIMPDDGQIAGLNEELASAYMAAIQDLAERGQMLYQALNAKGGAL